MATEQTQTYHWLKQIPLYLLQQDEIPLMGSPPPFPWESLSQTLAHRLEIPDLTITPAKSFEWKSKDQLATGLGDQVTTLHFSISPAGCPLYWMMAKEEIARLMSLLIHHSPQPVVSIDPEFEQGFYRFLALETINTIKELNYDSTLSAYILADNSIPQEDAVCLDVEISTQGQTIWGRVVLSTQLRNYLKEKFAERSLEIPLAKKINLSMHLEAGKVQLTPQEWNQVKLGDFILLDNCSINPEGQGFLKLSVNGLPVFNAELTEEGVKLMEYSEEGETMDQNEEELNQQNPPEELEDVDGEEDEESFDEEEEDLEIESEQPQEEWPPLPERRKKEERPAPVEQEEHIQAETEEEEQPVSLADVPLSIVVEAGRFQISLQKLLSLEPGNMIDLNVHPENGVDLVLNGRRIAKGELLLVGDTLGVRILDIG